MRFPILFEPAYAVLSRLLLLSPDDSYIELVDDSVQVRMAWGFRAVFRKSEIRVTARSARRPLSRGVHGFMGRWLVNGSGKNIVRIELASPQRARVMGIPVRLSELQVSAVDPDGLCKALSG
jgi:hypothetical protein